MEGMEHEEFILKLAERIVTYPYSTYCNKVVILTEPEPRSMPWNPV